MHNTLISALGNHSDILNCSVLINSLIKSNPNTRISVLTYKENESIIETIPHISKVHYLDKNTINQYFENPLFSDAFAINQFTSDLSICLTTTWDTIINFTNDSVSSLLLSSLQSKEVIGTSIAHNGAPNSSNRWASYLNYVNGNQPIHFIDNNFVRHHMCNTPIFQSGDFIKVDENYSAVAFKNFQKIRQTKNNGLIVGISLLNDDSGHSLDQDSLKDIIDILETSESYRVVLLLNGKEEEKNTVNSLNKQFNNSLISINTDFTTFSAVAVHLDCLISTSNIHARIADLVGTKLIQISNAINTVYQNANNHFILSDNHMNWSNDALFLINQEFNSSLPVGSMNTDLCTYSLIEDEVSIIRTQTRGPINIQQELRYHVGRCYHMAMMGYPINSELLNHIRTVTSPDDIEQFINESKDELTNTVRVLLATIRSLKVASQSKQNLLSFISHLDSLILKGQLQTLTAAAVALFEADLEKINSSNSDENMKFIEKRLFDLKNDLQIFTNILGELANGKSESLSSTEKNSY
jgi:ADP-heptose:LPS heptosyltransferase